MKRLSRLALGTISIGLVISVATYGGYYATKEKKENSQGVMSVHTPYSNQKCESCHTKIDSYEWKSDFCLTCHTKKSDELSKEYKHVPAIEDCMSCHDPHKSGFEYLLKKESKTLCLSCHEVDLKGNRIHSNLKKNCIECHSPHASEYDLLLKKGGHDICLLCHTQEEYNKKKLDKKNLTIQECIACHKQGDTFGTCCEKEE